MVKYTKKISISPTRLGRGLEPSGSKLIIQSYMAGFTISLFSTKSGGGRKKTNPTSKKDSRSKNLKGKSKRIMTPSAGFIGVTRLDLITQLFKGKLPMEWNLSDLLNKTIQSHDKLIKNRGVVHGTSKWKDITQYAIGLLEGRQPDNPGWVATGKVNKWPKALSHLLPVYIFIKDNIHNDNLDVKNQIAEAMRFCLTLFKLNKICTANSELLPLLKNIGKRKKLDPALVADFEIYSRKRLQDVRDRISLSDMGIKLFLSPSFGPNRLPKLESALEEAAVLAQNTKLYEAFKRICVITNNIHFFEFFSQCAKKYQALPSKLTNIKLRKLTAIPDKGNKARVIALCDIWTQSVLAALETEVIKVSKELFSANLAYFSHKEGWDKVMSLPPETLSRCVSLDASSWTDNFPASLQYIVVKGLFGESMGMCWKALAVDCEWYVPNYPRPVKFGKGQGMGTKGSFAIAQLTDLIFVEFILNREYKTSGSFFIKVGDDLVVEDPDHVLKIWYENIGVPINMSKSKFKTSFGNFQEFVSRNLWNNYDYSIISPSLVAKFLRNDFYALTLYYHVAERMCPNPSLAELFEQKKEILSSKPNFDLEKWNSRQNKLIKVINLLQIGCSLPPEILGGEPQTSIKDNEALLIAKKLILSTIGLVTYHTTKLNEDKTCIAQSNLTKLIVGELRIFKKTDTLPGLLSRESELFKGIVSLKLTFEEAVLLQRSSIFVDKISMALNKGSKSLTLEPRFQPLLKCNDTGGLLLNPEFVSYIFQIWSTLMEQVLNHNVVGSNPFENRRQGHSDLELFKFVNNCIPDDNENIILDLATGNYQIPGCKDKYIVLNTDLVDGYKQLFGFSGMLSEIDNYLKQ